MKKGYVYWIDTIEGECMIGIGTGQQHSFLVGYYFYEVEHGHICVPDWRVNIFGKL